MSPPTQHSPRVAALLGKMRSTRGRLIIALDQTASREPLRDLATSLTASMLEEAAKIGGLDIQLCYYRGHDEFQKTAWLSDAHELIGRMSSIGCMAGATQIGRVLGHVRAENERDRVAAAIFIGDACEEKPSELYAAAAVLDVPLFAFQEGDAFAMPPEYISARSALPPPPTVEQVFRDLARLTGGAYGKFDAGAAKQLGELLRAVAAFAVGGVKALTSQHTDAARKLLAQLK